MIIIMVVGRPIQLAANYCRIARSNYGSCANEDSGARVLAKTRAILICVSEVDITVQAS